MTKELMEKIMEIVYNSKELTIMQKIEFLQGANLFLLYYDENIKALDEIARKRKWTNE